MVGSGPSDPKVKLVVIGVKRGLTIWVLSYLSECILVVISDVALGGGDVIFLPTIL